MCQSIPYRDISCCAVGSNMSASGPKLRAHSTRTPFIEVAWLETHIADGQAQLNGLIIVSDELAQQQAVLQLRGVLVPVPPQVGRR